MEDGIDFISSILLECLFADGLVIVHIHFPELIQATVWCIPLIVNRYIARGVVRVLNFHSDEGRFVYSDSSGGRLPPSDAHVQFKALISLVLAILDASLLSWALCGERL